MLKKNADLILERIAPSDVVLDIGGWAQPFNRANYVLDIMPYETRGVFGSLGSGKECFSKDTWILHDLSSAKPLPFEDKQIDFVICSHTLEDIRDPIHLCSEIVRVGKRGYIEVPSRTLESIMGVEGKNYAGYYHHRWLVEIEGSEIIFRFKPHFLHESWRFHLPKHYLRKLSEEEKNTYLFWEETFRCKEVIQISRQTVAAELEDFVRRKQAYPGLFYIADAAKWKFKSKVKDALKRFPKLGAMAEKIFRRNLISSSDQSFWSSIPEVYSKGEEWKAVRK